MSETEPLCETLDWDSRFFGVSIARALPARVTAERCRAMLDWCRTEGVDCLYLLADDDPDTDRLLQSASFKRVDERVTLERELTSESSSFAADTRPSRLDDIPALRAIAAVSHRDSRFYNDGSFDRERCDEFYRVWIENSCRGWADHVVVAERNGTAVGYLTVHLRGPGASSIGLVGVDRALQRHGIGSHLLAGALAWVSDRSVTRMSVATQGRNSASQGFFQNAGFRRVSASVWYHRWFGPSDTAR